MKIDHLLLKRLDGSEFRKDDVEVSGDVRRKGGTVELNIPASGVIRGMVDQVDDQTTVSKISAPLATGQLTLWSSEVP
jgi:hypothetical protein